MYLVAGLGMTGQSVLRYFRYQGEACLAFDTRNNFDIEPLQSEFPNVTFACGAFPEDWLSQITTVVLSPGLSKKSDWLLPLLAENVPIIGDIELFARSVGQPLVAITGSNGKSTVATLVADVLNEAGYRCGLGGNIGQPALDLITDEQTYDVFVLELSSFQLETTYSLQPTSATVLNVSEDHMDRYDTLQEYLEAKLTILKNTRWAIVNNAFPQTPQVAKKLYFGLIDGEVLNDDQYGFIHKEGQVWLGHGHHPMVLRDHLKLQGTHHWLNALATMALCQPFEVAPQVFDRVFSRFCGLPHRTQKVAEQDGVAWINDSKGTNVGATLTAIESQASQITGKVILLLGGVGKGADFSPLKDAVNQYVRQVIVFGRDRALLAEQLNIPNLTEVETLTQAIEQAGHYAQSGDCVLFSPACASFDQFENYVARGAAFESLTLAYLKTKGVQ